MSVVHGNVSMEPSTFVASPDDYKPKNILVTGGAGFMYVHASCLSLMCSFIILWIHLFISPRASHFVILIVEKYPGLRVVNFDKLDYCSCLANLCDVAHRFAYVPRELGLGAANNIPPSGYSCFSYHIDCHLCWFLDTDIPFSSIYFFDALVFLRPALHPSQFCLNLVILTVSAVNWLFYACLITCEYHHYFVLSYVWLLFTIIVCK